jgi:hypothetical protein
VHLIKYTILISVFAVLAWSPSALSDDDEHGRGNVEVSSPRSGGKDVAQSSRLEGEGDPTNFVVKYADSL